MGGIELLKESIGDIVDPRRTECGNLCHTLETIIVIGLCTVIVGGEGYEDMEEFGDIRADMLKNFLDLRYGIPSADTFRRVFERLNPQEVSKCLYEWLDLVRKDRPVIAIDGKTICGSANAKHSAYHVVSAFVAENQITLFS